MANKNNAERMPELLTDLGNSTRLVRIFGRQLRFCDPLGGWLVWDGKRWAVDDTNQARRYVDEVVLSLFDEAKAELDKAQRGITALQADTTADGDARDHAMDALKLAFGKAKAKLSWALKSQHEARRAAMLKGAEYRPSVVVRAGVFDADPWLLNVDNGTLDLKTGQLREHNRADMITKLAPVAYDPTATDEMLTKYLSDTTGGDADFGAYLRKSCGYSLTGSTQEEIFFLMLGPAATGKSTLVEAMLTMLGDYGLKASFAAFLETRNAGGATPEIARLRGARMVAAVETSKGGRLNEPAIKELTGGDTVTARNLYAAPFSFKPACKLWLAANDAPRMTDTDTGLWRRLRRLPFEHELEIRDPEVKARLCAEAGPALLAWAVRGCLLWQREGLTACDVVKAKTSELRATFDPLAEFFGEQCITDRQAETPALHLRLAYEQWAASMGARPINDREWSQRLKAAGCERRRTMHQGQKVTVWAGIGLIADMSPEDPWMAADTHGHTKPPFAQTFSILKNPPHKRTLWEMALCVQGVQGWKMRAK